eukprot:FR742542.1.p1 GENE.FR742542.1~~FR742542.1.p1  ORF type:complete len:128 (+),score=11.48 FR742542.1:647-1030(+)
MIHHLTKPIRHLCEFEVWKIPKLMMHMKQVSREGYSTRQEALLGPFQDIDLKVRQKSAVFPPFPGHRSAPPARVGSRVLTKSSPWLRKSSSRPPGGPGGPNPQLLSPGAKARRPPKVFKWGRIFPNP